MLAYFPFYIEPIYHTLNSSKKHFSLLNKSELQIAFLGGGPLPELLGLMHFIGKTLQTVQTVNAFHLDITANWFDHEIENITSELLEDYSSIKANVKHKTLIFFTELLNIPEEIIEADIIVSQNCINDSNNHNQLFDNIIKITESMKENSILVLIDLKFSEVEKLMKKCEDHFRRMSLNIILPLTFKQIKSNIPQCSLLKENLYGDRDLMRARKYTKYYSLIVEKTNG